jgi:hypothetical protein
MRNISKTIIRNTKRKRQIGKTRHRWEENIRMGLREIGCEHVD